MVEQHCLSSSSSSSPPDVVSVYLHYHWESLLTHHQWDQWIHTPLILWILLLLFSIIYPDFLADLTDLLMDGPTAQCCAFAHSFIFVLTWSSCQLIWSVADLFHCLSLITRIVYLHCLPVARATLFCLIQQKVGGRWCSCQIAHLLCVLHVGNRIPSVSGHVNVTCSSGGADAWAALHVYVFFTYVQEAPFMLVCEEPDLGSLQVDPPGVSSRKNKAEATYLLCLQLEPPLDCSEQKGCA